MEGYMSSKRTIGLKGLISFLFTGLTIVAGIYIYVNIRNIQDWAILRNYQPATDIARLADETTMTAEGRKLFYVTNPKIEKAQSFNKNCHSNQEQTIVLGCYIPASGNIHIFAVDDPRLQGVKQVTAAHEMLHVAYDRLSGSDKDSVNKMIDQYVRLNKHERLESQIELYRKSEPGQYYNELHSIIGTESKGVGSELENYYARYFSNRDTIVNYSDGYQKVFLKMKSQLDSTDKILKDLKTSIDADSNNLSNMKQTINNEIKTMNELRQTDPGSYNLRVDGYNNMIDEYNQKVRIYSQKIKNYNKTVKQRNDIAIGYNDLNKEMDSTYDAIR